MAQDKQTVREDGRIIAEDALFRAKYAKEEMCQTEPMTDNPPILLVCYESDETTPNHDVNVECSEELGLSIPHLIAMIPLVHEEDVFDGFVSAIREIPKHKFSWILLVVEGYFRVADSNGELPDVGRGEMERDYKENPFSDVRESLIVYGMNWDSDMELTAHAPYSYDDHGVPVWDDEKWSVNDIEPDHDAGRMSVALRDGIKFMRLAVKATEIHDLMLRAAEIRDERNGDK